MATKTNSFSATGRRRTSVARVTITEGSGQIEINGLPFEEYLPTIPLQNELLAPFQAVKQMNKFDVKEGWRYQWSSWCNEARCSSFPHSF